MNLSVLPRGAAITALLFLTLWSLGSPVKAPQPVMLAELLRGTERGHPQPGHEFSGLRQYLPARGVISFIQDTPYDPSKLSPERLLMLQNFLSPRVISPEPGAPFAIIECSSHSKAQSRAAETGYRFVYDDLNGRGILERIS